MSLNLKFILQDKRVTGVFRVNSFEPSKINSKNESTNNSVKSSNIHLNNLSNSSNSPTNARNTLKPDTKVIFNP